MKYGCTSYIGNDDTPPEIVSAFLDHVNNFEEQHSNRPKITVSAILNNPILKSFEELTMDECQIEADRYVKLLEDNALVILLPDHNNARGKYRFIEKDEEFLLRMLNLIEDFEPTWLSDNCRDSMLSIVPQEAVKRIQTFRTMYKEIIPIGFEPKGQLPTKSGMFYEFGICWEGIPVSGGEKEKYEGLGVCQMALEDGEWMIQGVMIPGFEF
ncbi:MAG: hypothetical protein V3V00_07590 [Saprospiraceae bacterium]